MNRLGSAVLIGTLGVATLAAGCVVYTHEPTTSARRPPPGPPPGPGAPPPAAPPHGPPGPPPGPPPADPEASFDGATPRSPAPAQPPFEEPPEGSDKPELLAVGVAAGRPPSFRSGAPAGYWIWQGPRGSWLLRTTSAGLPHLFRGRVAGLTGEIVNVHPQRTEFRDRIHRGPRDWSFSFATDGHADGFTFMTRDGGCVRFALDLEAGPQPKRVFIGRAEVQPRGGTFVVCPAGKPPPPPPPG